MKSKQLLSCFVFFILKSQSGGKSIKYFVSNVIKNDLFCMFILLMYIITIYIHYCSLL